jgi:hypothetical protein
MLCGAEGDGDAGFGALGPLGLAEAVAAAGWSVSSAARAAGEPQPASVRTAVTVANATTPDRCLVRGRGRAACSAR